MSKIVVFEGADKTGKDTQSKLLAGVLKTMGFKVVRVEPTKEFALGKKLIYSMLESGAAKNYPNLFQIVQFVNRMYFQYFRLPQLLKKHDIVLCDRWALSGYIYGACEGINLRLNKWMYDRAAKADLTLVFSGKSYRRVQADDSYEGDTVLQSMVKTMYAKEGSYRKDHALIDNTESIMEVHHEIMEILDEDGILPGGCAICGARLNESCDAGLHS